MTFESAVGAGMGVSSSSWPWSFCPILSVHCHRQAVGRWDRVTPTVRGRGGLSRLGGHVGPALEEEEEMS